MTEDAALLPHAISTCFARPLAFDVERHLEDVVAAGFNAIELNLSTGSRDADWDQPSIVDAWVRGLSATGLAVTAVHAHGAWLPPADARGTRRAIHVATAHAALAAELGAPLAVVHVGRTFPDDGVARPDHLDALWDQLLHLTDGWPVRWGWENEALGLSAEEHLARLAQLPEDRVGLVLDTGHAAIQGDVATYLSHGLSRIVHVHLNDNDGVRDHHWLPGEGVIAWREAIEPLRAAPLTSWTIEVERRKSGPQTEAVAAFVGRAKASLEAVLNQPA